jgi:hypothetical protein
MLACVVTGRVARGGGEEFQLRAEDLVITVDGRWAGCRTGGYFPLRFQVANKAAGRELTFEFRGQERDTPTVRRTLHVPQNAVIRFTLLIPCVGTGTYGSLSILEHGRALQGLSQSLMLPDSRPGELQRPALLVIAPREVDLTAFEGAIGSILPTAAAGGSYGGSYAGGYGGSSHGAGYLISGITEDHQVVGPDLLPETWLAYSGLDLVAVPLRILSAMASEQRAALVQWVHVGGTLLVTEVGAPAARAAELSRLLELDQWTSAGDGWVAANPAAVGEVNPLDEQALAIGASEALSSETGAPLPEAGMVKAGDADAESGSSSDEARARFRWVRTPEAFAARDLVWGRVYAFPGDPFVGTPHDWSWFLGSLPSERRTWTARHGISARAGSSEFMNFQVPSVRGIPTGAFLLLITVFTLAIGPVNYYVLSKRRQQAWLLVTIPAIAIGTSAALLGYSLIAHGLSVKSRARTFTRLDQRNNLAVSAARISLYAGLAPARGLSFPPETAVYPIWPEGESLDRAAMDWTERQSLRVGWLRSRHRTQFLTWTHRDERGRVNIGAATDGSLAVTNGLEWDLDAVIVCDETGATYYGENLRAGEGEQLARLTEEQAQSFVRRAQEFPPSPPADRPVYGDSLLGFSFPAPFGTAAVSEIHFSNGLLEREWQRWTRVSGPEAMPPRSYVAVTRENPGVDLGVPRTKPDASIHLIVGQLCLGPPPPPAPRRGP